LKNDTTQYTHNPDFIYRKIVEEMILVPICQDIADMNCIYTLNPVGAFIWQQLEMPKTRNELEKAILAEFDVGHEPILKDLEDFIREMLAIGVIKEEHK